MRADGYYPYLDDYHLIMLHNAVWGNVEGSIALLNELIEFGRIPNARTYELVLYALSRKLSLVRPWEHSRAKLLVMVEQAFNDIVVQMTERYIQHSPKIKDHCVRIIGMVSSPPIFERAVVGLAGIDVNQPDVIPPRFVEQYQKMVEEDRKAGASSSNDSTLPIVSTAMLNTLVRVLGSGPTPSLSAMIGVFESLTAPIPPLASNNESFGYEDGVVDDDETYYLPPNAVSDAFRRSEPVRPNTQTYSYLIRNCLMLDNKVLAKHYLQQVLDEERKQERRIRDRIRGFLGDPAVEGGKVTITVEGMEKVRTDTPRGHVAANVHMFKAIYRYADRTADIQLMRWLRRREFETVMEKEATVALLIAVADAIDLVEGEVSGLLGEDAELRKRNSLH
jgi:hypothetical protein